MKWRWGIFINMPLSYSTDNTLVYFAVYVSIYLSFVRISPLDFFIDACCHFFMHFSSFSRFFLHVFKFSSSFLFHAFHYTLCCFCREFLPLFVVSIRAFDLNILHGGCRLFSHQVECLPSVTPLKAPLGIIFIVYWFHFRFLCICTTDNRHKQTGFECLFQRKLLESTRIGWGKMRRT